MAVPQLAFLFAGFTALLLLIVPLMTRIDTVTTTIFLAASSFSWFVFFFFSRDVQPGQNPAVDLLPLGVIGLMMGIVTAALFIDKGYDVLVEELPRRSL